MRIVCFYFGAFANLKNIAEVFYRFTPEIAVSDTAVFVNLERCSLMYTEAQFLKVSRSLLSQLELKPKIGVGPSIPLALADACFGSQDLKRIPLYFLKHFLSPFHTDEAAEKSLVEMLWYFERLGFKNIHDFLSIPRRELSSRFGAQGLLLHQRVVNSTTILWPKFIPEEKVNERKDFDSEVELDSVEPLIFVLKNLLDHISLRLISRGLTLKSFEARLLLEKNSVITNDFYAIPIELAFTGMSIKTLLQLFRDKADHLLRKKPLPGKITGLEVAVVETAPYVPSQRDIFNPKKEENEEIYLDLVNRLSLKLGETKVFKAGLTESYLPERNWERQKDLCENPKLDNLPTRPLRILPNPLPLFYSNGELHFQGETVRLSQTAQYEILFSDWWNASKERLYFSATSSKHRRLWIYRSADTYFLHGVFD